MKRSMRRLLLELGGGLTYDQYIASLAPLLWYRFKETSGTITLNYGSLSSADGTIAGTPSTDYDQGQTGLGNGGPNEAYDLKALAGRVTTPTLADVNNLTVFTYGVLLKADSAGAANAGRIQVGATSNNRNMQVVAAGPPIRVTATQVAATTTATSTTSGAAAPAGGLTPGTAYFVFWQYDDAGDRKIDIYIGAAGALTEAAYSIQQAAVDAISLPTGAMVLGNDNGGIRGWDGLYDEFFVFGHLLTTTEMLQIVKLRGV